MTVTTAPDGANSYTQTGATSTRYADNGSADGNGSKPEQNTDNTGDIENEYNRDFRDPVRNALGVAATGAQAIHDGLDPCMGAKTAGGCTAAIVLQAALTPVLTREIRGAKVYTDKAGAEIIDQGDDYLYRGLADGEDVSTGITARLPGAGNSPISHVAGQRESQWISTTKSYETASQKYGQFGVIRIDKSKINTDIYDASGGFGKGMISNWAKRDKEVLVKDNIPANAIERIR